jgi:hypothetical protein
LLEGYWEAPETAGLQAEGIWKQIFQRLPIAARIRILDLLSEGEQQDVLEEANRDPELNAALQLASDPEQKNLSLPLKAAMLAVSQASSTEPSVLIDAILRGLVECAHGLQRTDRIRNLLHAALVNAAQRLPLGDSEESAAAWAALSGRVPRDLPTLDRAIVLFNLAGGAFDRLAGPPFAQPMASAVQALFDEVIAAGPPPDLAPLVQERRGELRLGVVPPDEGGSKDLREAAGLYEALGRPLDAIRAWHQLMRWHARRAGTGTGDIVAEAEAALSAGATALSLSSSMPPKQVLELAQEVANFAWHMPGDGRVERLAYAAQLYRLIVSLAGQFKTPKSEALANLNLANILLDNAGGDDAAIVEEAIAVLLKMSDMPAVATDRELRRMQLATLALAYKRRTTGDPKENLDQAIVYYRRVLDDVDAKWTAGQVAEEAAEDDVLVGSTRYNLANALLRRLRGDRRANLAEALALHEEVSADREAGNAHVQLQARSWISIGNVNYEWALLDSPPDEARLHKAIGAYRHAQQLLNPSEMLNDAALAKMLEGQAHAMLPASDATHVVALGCYTQAAELAARMGDVAALEDIASRRGSLLFRKQNWAEAVEAYADASRLRRTLMAKAISGLTRYRQLASIAPYGARLAYALIRCGRLDEAIDALHASRALDLSAALLGVQDDTAEAIRYREARARVLALEHGEEALAAGELGEDNESAKPGVALHALHQELQTARSELEAATDALRGEEDDPSGRGYSRLVKQVGIDELLVVPIVTDAGSVVVFATGTDPKAYPNNIFFLDDVRLSDVRALLGVGLARTNADERPPEPTLPDDTIPTDPYLPGWRQIVTSVASAGPSINRAEIARSMGRFLTMLGRMPIVRALRERLDETDARALRVIAHGGIQSLPLSMAADPDSGVPLAQQVTFIEQIGFATKQPRLGLKPSRTRLLVVADPQSNLPFSRWEAALIAAQVGHLSDSECGAEIELLQGPDATTEALLDRIEWADILHFAGHAAHDWDRPTHSSLLCADGALSVVGLREVTKRAPLKLVVLSACDSGLTDVDRCQKSSSGCLPHSSRLVPTRLSARCGRCLTKPPLCSWPSSIGRCSATENNMQTRFLRRSGTWQTALQKSYALLIGSKSCTRQDNAVMCNSLVGLLHTGVILKINHSRIHYIGVLMCANCGSGCVTCSIIVFCHGPVETPIRQFCICEDLTFFVLFYSFVEGCLGP